MSRVYRNFALQQVKTIYSLMESIKQTWKENKELLKIKIKSLHFCDDCSIKDEIFNILENDSGSEEEFIEECELCLQKMNCENCSKRKGDKND